MSRKKIRLQMIRPTTGWPAVGEVVRVELTDQVQAVLDQGLGIDLGDDNVQVPAELDQENEQATSGPAVPSQDDGERPADTGDQNGPADPPTNPDEEIAPDGSTALPAKKTPAKKTGRRAG